MELFTFNTLTNSNLTEKADLFSQATNAWYGIYKTFQKQAKCTRRNFPLAPLFFRKQSFKFFKRTNYTVAAGQF